MLSSQIKYKFIDIWEFLAYINIQNNLLDHNFPTLTIMLASNLHHLYFFNIPAKGTITVLYNRL